MDNKIDRKINVSPVQFLLVQNRQQTHGWTLIGSGANGLGILEWNCDVYSNISNLSPYSILAAALGVSYILSLNFSNNDWRIFLNSIWSISTISGFRFNLFILSRNLCLSVCLSDNNSETLDRFASNFDWGTCENHGNVLSRGLRVLVVGRLY